MSGQVGLPKPGEADPSIPLYDGEHDLATEFDEVAVSLRADVKRLAVGEADDLERDTVAWLRHLIETLDLALLVTGPEPGKDWNLIPFPDVGPTGTHARTARPNTRKPQKRSTPLQGGLRTPSTSDLPGSSPSFSGEPRTGR